MPKLASITTFAMLVCGQTLVIAATITTESFPAAGNPAGRCAVPTEAQAEDVSRSTNVIGNGTATSCTSDAVVKAVARGGVITFNCGPEPVTITLSQTAKIFNNTGPKIVIDGGGKVTLSGGGKTRILYMNTCDQAQVWTTSHCQDQDHPQLTLQNLTLVDGNAKGLDPDGGGAIWVRGGRFKLVNTRFFRNQCDDTGPDVGGAAVRVFSQSQNLPVYVVGSTFGGRNDLGNVCSNGGALSSIGVSFSILNSLFSHNKAIGNGANPARTSTPGGGSGGAIYNDGNTFNLNLCGSDINNNSAKEGGGAVFFVSNDRSGSLSIDRSNLSANPSAGFETAGYPGMFYLGKGNPQIINSSLLSGRPTVAMDCVLAWAERNYASLLSPSSRSQTVEPFYFRYYSSTQSYLGFSANDSHLYYFGGASNNKLLDLGAWLSWAQTAGC